MEVSTSSLGREGAEGYRTGGCWRRWQFSSFRRGYLFTSPQGV